MHTMYKVSNSQNQSSTKDMENENLQKMHDKSIKAVKG